ncbi:hypothetical protein ACFE04_025230 [Oxalis oulophora]
MERRSMITGEELSEWSVAVNLVEFGGCWKLIPKRKLALLAKSLEPHTSPLLVLWGKDNESIQGKEPNVDSFSNTQSGNATKRQTVRKPNVEKDQGKTTKLNVSKVAQSYSHNVSESSTTPSHNVTSKKNIKRKTFASNVSSGNVKRKKSVPKSANRSGSVSESSAAQSGTVGRSAAQSGTVGRSAARTNTTQTQSGTVGRSAVRTVNTTQTQSDTVGRSSAHTKQTRSGTAGRSSAQPGDSGGSSSNQNNCD